MLKIKNILLLVTLISSSIFANNIATITALKGDASIDRDSSKIKATLGYKLKTKDSILTKDNTKMQVVFKDNTIVTIGKNSNFSIEEYLFDDTNEPVVSFGLFKGAVRTITGQIGKVAPEKFQLKTNNATIGIRGTNFSVYAHENNSQNIYCTYGAISISFKGDEFTVKQGFQLEISPNLKAKVQAFSPVELKKLNDTSFGASTTKKGTLSKVNQPVQAVLIDTTTNDNININIQKIEEQQEVVSNTVNDTIVKKDDIHSDEYVIVVPTHTVPVIEEPVVEEPIIEEPATEEPTQDVAEHNLDAISDFRLGPVITNNSIPNMAEAIIFYDNNDNSSDALIYFNAITRHSLDYTKSFFYNLTSIPATYNENFNTHFSSITAMDNATSETTTITVGQTNSFRATTDDLSPTDAMQWGDWAISYEYEGTTVNESGFWLAGDMTADTRTNETIISSYSISSVDYTGIYKAIKYPGYSSQEIVQGTALMNVDFAANKASLTINNSNDSGVWATYSNIEISTGAQIMVGVQDGTTSGTALATGAFYGETGNSVGGTFTVEDKDAFLEAKGVYQVQTTTTLH